MLRLWLGAARIPIDRHIACALHATCAGAATTASGTEKNNSVALAYDSTVRLNQAYTSALISNFNYDDAALIAVAMPHYPLDTAFVATLLPESAPHFEKWRTEYLRNDHPSW